MWENGFKYTVKVANETLYISSKPCRNRFEHLRGDRIVISSVFHRSVSSVKDSNDVEWRNDVPFLD